MNKLILYFLFFVVSALILVQCAMLFPSTNQPQKQPVATKANNNTGRAKLIATITNVSVGDAPKKK